jgi:hypothetical protein
MASSISLWLTAGAFCAKATGAARRKSAVEVFMLAPNLRKLSL